MPQPETHRGIAISYQPLKELVPYARNPRTHPKTQIRKLRNSLALYGWTNPMLIADGQMIAGHARLQAALAMAEEGEAIRENPDPWEGPTVDLSHLSPTERRAYVIVDNRSAEDGSWSDEVLRTELAELKVEGFDLLATGFDLPEITKLLTPPEPKIERELTDAENDTLDLAWKRLVTDWYTVIESAVERGYISTSFTRGALQVYFLRALFLGEDIPRPATLAYTTQRLFTVGDRGSIPQVMSKARDSRPLRDSLRWSLEEKPILDRMTSGSLAIHRHRIPNEFPPLLARNLIDEFCPAHGSVLDPCHGWGGRALGFLLSRADTYYGIDASPETVQGVRDMCTDLLALIPDAGKAVALDCTPFEDAVLSPGIYDFALTSPPYYDTEKYPGELSSWQRYPDFEAWCDGFYRKLIEGVARALKPGATFALQVGSQTYPLTERAIALASGCGLMHAGTRPTNMTNNYNETDPEAGEVVVLLRKQW